MKIGSILETDMKKMETIYYRSVIIDLLIDGLISIETALTLLIEIRKNLLAYNQN
jgi:hypothetical protein